jgi:hypothetical protein
MGAMRGGPRVLSPEFGWGQRVFNRQAGAINAYRKHFDSSKERGGPDACLRPAKA